VTEKFCNLVAEQPWRNWGWGLDIFVCKKVRSVIKRVCLDSSMSPVKSLEWSTRKTNIYAPSFSGSSKRHCRNPAAWLLQSLELTAEQATAPIGPELSTRTAPQTQVRLRTKSRREVRSPNNFASKGHPVNGVAPTESGRPRFIRGELWSHRKEKWQHRPGCNPDGAGRVSPRSNTGFDLSSAPANRATKWLDRTGGTAAGGSGQPDFAFRSVAVQHKSASRFERLCH